MKQNTQYRILLILSAIAMITIALQDRPSLYPTNDTVVLVPRITPIVGDYRVYVQQELKKAGLLSEWPVVEHMVACESGWTLWKDSPTSDSGLWQINAIHRLPESCMHDLICSTEWAISKRLRDGNWNAWSCYRLIN